ncbi:MAG: ATP-binding protein [Candidatus Omnitrophota bacterium]|nr:ATP-binding protein [Candidatus Omnitrophota bacterium]
MFIKSIRFKITILYMAILALTISSFSAVLYHNVSKGLYNSMDILLKSKAGGISKAINTYWEASSLEALASGVKPDEVLKKRRNFNFTKVAQNWVREESKDPELLNIIVTVFDTDGATIASSKNAQGLTRIPGRDFIFVLQGKIRFDTLGSMRMYTTPVFENEKVAYIVQVASSLAPMQIALNNIKVALFVLFPITVSVTGILGALLAKVTLRPVDRMIHTIHQITAENMKLRLGIPDTKDEIQKLAETFNSMLERLELAFTLQKKLFENLSHELKTPLTILKGEFEVVLKKMRSQSEYEETLKSALEEVDRMTRLAGNLLELARLESKEVFPEKKRLDLNPIVREIVNNVRILAESKKINLSCRADEVLFLEADESQLKMLLLNVLDNAVKYTESGGRITVMSQKSGPSAVVRIEDTGAGITKEEIEYIFDRFYRTDKARASAGFGLGLSIAKSIVDAHNGSIKAESEPSKGTVFTISLPLH